jgi:hypothetical protein
MSTFIILRDTLGEGFITFEGLELEPIYDLNELCITVQDIIEEILTEDGVESIESYEKIEDKIPLDEQICIFKIAEEIDNLSINDFIYDQMHKLKMKQAKDRDNHDKGDYELYLKLKDKYES